MAEQELHVVTGAFGYSGQYIARQLLDAGHAVRTLTNSPDRENPFGGRVEPYPYHFDQPAELVRALRGASVLYNTYWVRFDHRDFNHAQAVKNTRTLFTAAKAAGVGRIVHVSITNPSAESDLPYFRGKAELEGALQETGVSYAILRPTVLFGREDVLINNIAWMLRRFPVFGVFGNGQYKLQPIYVDDLAGLAVKHGRATQNVVLNAIGPETFTYCELVRAIGAAIGRQRPILSIPPRFGLRVARLVGWAMGDVLVTEEEIRGLMEGRLAVSSPPTATTRLSEWAKAHAEDLGRRYSSEMARRRNREKSYAALRGS